MGYHPGRMQAPTLLPRPKIQKLRDRWPAFRQPVPDNQRQDKHVESPLALYSDGGSTPPISTKTGPHGPVFVWEMGGASAAKAASSVVWGTSPDPSRPCRGLLKQACASRGPVHLRIKIAGAKVIVFAPMRLQNHCCGSKLWPFCARRRLRYSLEAQIDGKHQYKRKKDDSPTQID